MKVEGPKEDPDVKARRERVEARADATREDETKRRLRDDTNELLRIFGSRAFSGNLVAPGSGSGSAVGGDWLTGVISQMFSSGLGGAPAPSGGAAAGTVSGAAGRGGSGSDYVLP
jgi:hypothetical protein